MQIYKVQRVNRLKKAFYFLLAAAVITAGVAYYHPPFKHYLVRLFDDVMPTEMTHNKTYRWKDENGQWVFGSEPPEGDIPFEAVEYHKDTNVIPTEELTGQKKD